MLGYARRVSQRRDARRSRALIVTAAIEVFREEGAGAPLDLVARRAGVGRGTLYRHFPSRGTLLAAVLEMRLAALEAYAADCRDDDLLEHLLVEICALQARVPGLMAVVRGSDAPPRKLEEVVLRTQALLAEAVGRARRSGTVRPDVGLGDVLLAIAMIDGVVTARPTMPEPVPVERALALVLRALRSDHRIELPVPRPPLDPPTGENREEAS